MGRVSKDTKFPPLISDEIRRRYPKIKSKQFLKDIPAELVIRLSKGEPLVSIVAEHSEFLAALEKHLGEPKEYWVSIDAEYQKWRKENFNDL